jgi:hypothetical protein
MIFHNDGADSHAVSPKALWFSCSTSQYPLY